ncbi:MAG: 50S ribosomal protein L11 methyltransferase [Chloroflexi bacterium]|nr:50S ribosomal protein L11 methyltransferase [Chloroflexota bacterium]
MSRAPLHPDVRLRRVADVRMQLTGANTLIIEGPTGTLDCGYVGVSLLQRFSQPTSLRELAAEPAAGAQEWIDRTSVALHMVRIGIVRDVEDASREPAPPSYSFDNPGDHVTMLDDSVRTGRFVEAVGRTVRPGDVVVEIGTGTGILAMAAARAGAQHVYAIEAGAIAEHAQWVIAANGYADRITIIRGWSTTVSIPERADVLISETIGNDPLGERILETIRDASHRLLKPGARVVPERLRIIGVAVEIPDEWIARRVYSEAAVRRWEERYGFSFDALLLKERRLDGRWVSADTARAWTRLCRPQVLADIDLRSVSTTTIDAESVTPITESGRFDGGTLHFDAELGGGITLTSDPMASAEDTSWRNAVTVEPPVQVRSGDRIRLRYRWSALTGGSGLTISPVETAVHGAAGRVSS